MAMAHGKYHPWEMWIELIYPFAKTWMIGGLKGMVIPYLQRDHWVQRCRFILTHLNDDLLADLVYYSTFPIREAEGYYRTQINLSAPYTLPTTCWIAGLLHARQHRDQLCQAIRENHNRYDSFYFTGCIAFLLLIHDEECKRTLEHLASDRIESEKIMAEYALQIWDQPFVRPLPEHESRPHKFVKLLDRILEATYYLQGNLPQGTSAQIRQAYHDLLQDTTSPDDRLLATWEPIVIQPYIEPIGWKHGDPDPDYHPSPHNRSLAWLYRSIFSAVELHTQDYLLHGRPETLRQLQVDIRNCNDWRELMAMLEMDGTYRLPLEVVDACFERLHEVLNRSYQLLEKHAFHLLMHGPGRDAQAAALQAEADAIKARYVREPWPWKDTNVTMLRV